MGRQARLFLAGVSLLAGCKGFWNPPSSSGGGGTGATGSVFYVLNQQASQLVAYSIVKGTLTPLTGSPFTLPSGPYAIAVAPNNAFLYVSTATGIYLYTIGTGGVPALANSTPIASDTAAYALQVDSTNSWLLEASGVGYLYAIPINPANGAVSTTATEQQVALSSNSAQKMAISPDNKYVFVALGNGGTAVVPFTAANADPLPAAITTIIAVKGNGTGGAAVSVAIDPTSTPRLFYIGEVAVTAGSSNTGGVRAFSYSSLSSGTPTEVSGSPYSSGGLAPNSILPTPYSTTPGAYIYVANRTVTGSTAGNICGFALTSTGTTYTLTALTTTASTGIYPVSLAQDATGNYLLAVDSGGSPDLEAYTFDSTTAGKLDSAFTSTTGTDPVGAIAIAAAP
jgi:6-phosphogluconolactonase (cycloisomerase 2 family)